MYIFIYFHKYNVVALSCSDVLRLRLVVCVHMEIKEIFRKNIYIYVLDKQLILKKQQLV